MFRGKKNNIHEQGRALLKEYAQSDDPNSACRPKMEDSFIQKDNFLNDNTTSLFGVQDGHGGPEVANLSAQNIPIIFSKLYRNGQGGDLKTVFENTIVKLEAQLRMTGAMDVGATCLLLLSRLEQGSRILYFANIGDTRATICSGGKGVRITTDHKATEPTEINRVRKEGGMIMNNRLGGQLAVTRALGDFGMKNHCLTSTPEFIRRQIFAGDDFLIIATDGLWDVMDDQRAVDIVLKSPNISAAANNLVEIALKEGTMDNITVLVVNLR